MRIPLGKQLKYFGPPVITMPANGHAAFYGKTGSGKSSLALSQVTHHIKNGDGVGVIDPHGELVDDILKHIPSNRTDDVILIDPSDIEWVFRLPLLRAQTFEGRVKKLGQVVSILSALFPNGWGGASDRNAFNVGYAVLCKEQAPTLAHLLKAFTSKPYRESLRPYIDAANVDLFFQQFDEDWNASQRNTAAAPITNKIDFLSKPFLREMVGSYQGASMGAIMNAKPIFLLRLSAGRMDSKLVSAIASLVMSEILSEALEREAIAKEEREDFYLYMDEFHSIVRPGEVTFEEMFRSLRKYGVHLTILDQTTGGRDFEDLTKAILGNIGTLGVGRVGPEDAELLANALPIQEPKTLVRMDAHTWYVTTTNDDGTTSDPHLMKSFRPPVPLSKGKRARLESIQNRTRTNYLHSRKKVSDHINKILT
ncbi:MAG TPA: hypothetical protein VE974_06225 [Thermoanaerobaculia bacterium]|nr:hypothetical protein [Thermoanaerobaculia bacterium]